MAVLCEAISVAVKAGRIQELPGWDEFKSLVANATLCADGELVRVGFMHPDSVKKFIDQLEDGGLRYRDGSTALDLVVGDQMSGPLANCDWLEFGRIDLGEGGSQVISAAKLLGSAIDTVSCPDGWKYDGSISHTFGFVPNGAEDASLTFLRHENGIDVMLNRLTGKEAHVARNRE
jgi:hypothetical protein